MKRETPKIWSVDKLLKEKIVIPNYQRPYKWTIKNITELVLDIQRGVEESIKFPNFKYRIGTIILHKTEKKYEIVDGQQRILSLLLLKLCLRSYLNFDFQCDLLNTKFANKITQTNLHNNYTAIREWFSSVDDSGRWAINKAFRDTLEVVVIVVNKIDEAFQLFDSQNTRGRALYPHDLLKAYHLRAIDDKYDMQNAVVKWESRKPEAIRELFDRYLFPLWNWVKCRKSGNFTVAEIDIYKGIEEDVGYTYARRAGRAMPYFLLTEPFVSGKDFFEMVDHYMLMLHNIKEEIVTNPDFRDIKLILIKEDIKKEDTKEKDVDSVAEFDETRKSLSAGFNYARNLFLCALLCYYDRFHNFDVMAVKKLFIWALMIRVDMQHLGFDTINQYARGEENERYSNSKPVISMIASARRHTEIASMRLNMRASNSAASEKWNELNEKLRKLNGYN